MTESLRRQLITYLLRNNWDLSVLANKPDESLMSYVSERLTNVMKDREDLKAAGLWPMPKWLEKRSLKYHGPVACEAIIEMSNRDRRTVYA